MIIYEQNKLKKIIEIEMFIKFGWSWWLLEKQLRWSDGLKKGGVLKTLAGIALLMLDLAGF